MTGYLYQARAFVPFRPVKMHGLWPLAWVWSVVRTRTSDIALRSGVDSAAYVCVLNGVWLFAVSQLLTTFPVLLALHLHFSPSSYAPTDLNRASLSALVSDKDNVHLLFVHVLLLWWMTLAFYLTIIRIGRQILRLRRLVLRDESQNQAQHVPQDASHRGWRHRTLLVTNIPTEMRSEEKLTAYFDDMLKLPRVQAAATSATTPSTDKKTVNPNHNKGKVPVQIAPKPAYPPTPAAHPVRRLSDHENPISRIVLVRRTGELHETFKKREDALHQLEKAHAQLAVNVLRATKRHLNRTRSTQAPQPNSAEEKSTEDVEMDFIAQKLQPYLDPLQSNNNKSIWEALSELPKDMLDPFQPTRALKVFKDQRVAELDYWVAKFNLYSVLLDDLRASPRDSFKPTPTAFVTFNSAAQARRLAQQVPHHPERVWACLLERAPDTRDLVSGCCWICSTFVVVLSGAYISVPGLGQAGSQQLSRRCPSLRGGSNARLVSRWLYAKLDLLANTSCCIGRSFSSGSSPLVSSSLWSRSTTWQPSSQLLTSIFRPTPTRSRSSHLSFPPSCFPCSSFSYPPCSSNCRTAPNISSPSASCTTPYFVATTHF